MEMLTKESSKLYEKKYVKHPFDAYAPRASKGSTYYMAKIAKLSYGQESGSSDKNKILMSLKADDSGFEDVYCFSKDNSQGLVLSHRNYIIVAFRGTDEAKDWLFNINFATTKVYFGKFHTGFYDATQLIWPDMEQKICELQDKKKRPLYITGHSLGAAMATVVSSELLYGEDPLFMGTYTFGSPRCMTEKTAEIFNNKAKGCVFRFHHGDDIVTAVPLKDYGFGHVGICHFILDTGEIVKGYQKWQEYLKQRQDTLRKVKEYFDKKRANSIKEESRENSQFLEKLKIVGIGIKGLLNHKIEEYLKKIDACSASSFD